MQQVDVDAHFTDSYQNCREKFLARVKAIRFSGLNVMSSDYILPVRGPRFEILAIDFVKIWSHNDYTKALIISSGVHGPELFAGSAVQSQLLDDLKRGLVFLPRDTVLLLIHSVNPFGAAWLRRTNLRNIDLNRNFVPNFPLTLEREHLHKEVVQTHEIYREYQGLFDPRPRSVFDFPRLSLGMMMLRYGLKAARFALSSGQRESPMGLFYGGRALEPESIAVVKKVEEMLFQVGHQVTRTIHIDIHTGLGDFKDQILIGNHKTDIPVLAHILGKVAQADTHGMVLIKGPMEGSIQEGLPRLLKEVKHVNWLGLGLEYGTEGWMGRFLTLRNENSSHFAYQEFEQFINLEDSEEQKKAILYVQDPAKQELLQTYNPDDAGWRKSVLKQGRLVITRSLFTLGDVPRQKL